MFKYGNNDGCDDGDGDGDDGDDGDGDDDDGDDGDDDDDDDHHSVLLGCRCLNKAITGAITRALLVAHFSQCNIQETIIISITIIIIIIVAIIITIVVITIIIGITIVIFTIIIIIITSCCPLLSFFSIHFHLQNVEN